jgi:hypothetical protein
MLIYISTFRNIRQTFTLLYTFRYRFQGLISQKVDKIRPPDQHVSDQQHEKENRKRNFKQRACGKRSNANSALKLQNLIQFWRIYKAIFFR